MEYRKHHTQNQHGLVAMILSSCFHSKRLGSVLTERALRHLIQKYMRLAGLEGFSAHDLRHRFGYVMAEKTPLHRLAQERRVLIMPGRIFGSNNGYVRFSYARTDSNEIVSGINRFAKAYYSLN